MYYPKGTIASMVTCFKENGDIDFEGVAKNIEFQRKAGAKTICVLGGTGEAASMTLEERHQVMKEAMKHTKGMNVVLGALAGRPSDVMADIEVAKEVGADACLVMATPFVRPSERDVERLMKEYASLKMPLIIFNTPSRSAFSMSAALISRLAKIDGIVGIKESSGDMVLVQNIRIDCPHPFGLLTGGDNLYLPTMALGGDGGILASAAAIPEVCLALDDALAKNDYDTAREYHYAVKLLDDVLYSASHPVPLKLAMAYRGLPAGKCRPPFSDITEEHKKQIYDVMDEIERRMKGKINFVSGSFKIK